MKTYDFTPGKITEQIFQDSESTQTNILRSILPSYFRFPSKIRPNLMVNSTISRYLWINNEAGKPAGNVI